MKYLWYLETIHNQNERELAKEVLGGLYSQAGDYLLLKDCVSYSLRLISEGSDKVAQKLAIIGRYLYELDQAVAYPYFTYLRRHHPKLKVEWQQNKKLVAKKKVEVYSDLRRKEK